MASFAELGSWICELGSILGIRYLHGTVAFEYVESETGYGRCKIISIFRMRRRTIVRLR